MQKRLCWIRITLKNQLNIIFTGVIKFKKELDKFKISTNEITANFFLLNFNKSKLTSKLVSKRLESKGVILREMDSYGIKNCLRVTIGNTYENKFFLKQISKIFKNV